MKHLSPVELELIPIKNIVIDTHEKDLRNL